MCEYYNTCKFRGVYYHVIEWFVGTESSSHEKPYYLQLISE